jgi:hypothetical protein
MILASSEVKAFMNVSTSSTSYDDLISLYIPVVANQIAEISNHWYHDQKRRVSQYNLLFSSNKTITIGSGSTVDWTIKFQPGDTIHIVNAYWNQNNGFKTVSTRTTSILTLEESISTENSTDFNLTTEIHGCYFPDSIKKIAAGMIWFNVNNPDTLEGDKGSEGYGGYSVSWKDTGKEGYGTYPRSLISGLKKVVKGK